MTALGGGYVNVNTIHGEVSMKLNPGIQFGELKKLANMGVKDPNNMYSSGHHYVKIMVEIPK